MTYGKRQMFPIPDDIENALVKASFGGRPSAIGMLKANLSMPYQ